MCEKSSRMIYSIVLFMLSVIALQAQGQYEHASKRLLTAEDLDGMGKQELKIIRNEIFARYGYKFKTTDMQEHFSAQSWYRGSVTDVSKRLTPIEKKNIEFIKSFEDHGADKAGKNKASIYAGIKAPNGLEVADVEVHRYDEEHYDDGGGFRESTDGVAVIVLKDRNRSWSVYKFGDDKDADESHGEQLSRELVGSLLLEEPLFSGDGNTPRFDLKRRMWTGNDEAQWNGKTRQLSDGFWGDYYLKSSWSLGVGDLVALPTANEDGRIGDIRIERVLHSEGNSGLWFLTPEQEYYYANGSAPYAYTPPDENILRYTYLDDAFLLKVGSAKASNWVLYTSGRNNGVQLPIDSALEPQLVMCYSDNDQIDMCDYVIFLQKSTLKAVCDMASGACYVFPPGTRQLNAKEQKKYGLDNDIRNFFLPGHGVVKLPQWWSYDLSLTSAEEREDPSIDIEQFRVR